MASCHTTLLPGSQFYDLAHGNEEPDQTHRSEASFACIAGTEAASDTGSGVGFARKSCATDCEARRVVLQETGVREDQAARTAVTGKTET